MTVFLDEYRLQSAKNSYSLSDGWQTSSDKVQHSSQLKAIHALYRFILTNFLATTANHTFSDQQQ